MFRYQPTRGKEGIVVDQLITAGHKLPLGKIQDVHEESEVQNYDIGTRMVMDDRVFRYCRAKEALDPLMGARADVMPREGAADAVAYEVGEKVITIPMNSNGPDYTAEKTLNYWAEGYVWFQLGAVHQMYRIKSSAVATTVGRTTSVTGGFVDITLYETLKKRVTASVWLTAWVNPYKVCKHEHNTRMSIIAMPLIDVTINYYFWGQTWGPCFGTQFSTKPGLAAADREVYFSSSGDGSLITGVDHHTNGGDAQERGAHCHR